MSASPAGSAPGADANGSGKQPPRRLARPKPTNPLVSRKPAKKPGSSRPPPPTSAPKSTGGGQHGSLASRPGASGKTQSNNKDIKKLLASLPLEDRPFGDTNPSLFEQPPKPGTFTDYNVYTTKKALLEGLRLHVARLSSHKKFDIRDTSQFTPPLYLLRRDIRAPIPGTKEEPELKEEQEEKTEDAEGEAEREAAKAAAKAQIAPSMSAAKPRKQQQTKKTSQVFMKEQTEEQKYKSQLKYEESLPWHLEDDEHKQSWMGTYEEMSSRTWGQFSFENRNGENVAILTPLEKWYKFTPKIRINAEVLKQFEEQQKARPRSASPEFMKAFERQANKEKVAREDDQAARGRFFATKSKSDDLGVKADEELDFEEDWADDEAPAEIEGEEDDVKDIEKRIKKDQLKSNVFNMVGQHIYEDEDEREKREQEYRKKVGKKTAKALVKREHNAIYESDEENQYKESSDSTDTEEEIAREKEKKEAEAKAAAANIAVPGNKTGSGASSRNNTPGSRPSKHPLPLSKSAAGLKRPGSPNLSDASGNESSTARKKHKKSKMPGSNLVPNSNPPSRPRSPANGVQTNRPPIAARGSFAGSGSDTDTPGGSRMLARRNLALGNRSPSPANGSGTPGASRMGSRAGSPDVAAAAVPAQKFTSVPSNDVLRSLIPPQGLPLNRLSKYFDITPEEQKILMSKFREVSVYDKPTKTLKPLPAK